MFVWGAPLGAPLSLRGVTPLAVEWDDGRVYEIDRVLDRRQAASLKVGGTGVRYLVRIGNAATYLFHENPKWFVERKLFG